MHQIEIYVHWINSQLERLPNSRRIKDLAHDMRDGVVFLQLLQVIGWCIYLDKFLRTKVIGNIESKI